ncbi:MAG: hypothetical protein V4508_08340 [Pseudomonadota bacterium]
MTTTSAANGMRWIVPILGLTLVLLSLNVRAAEIAERINVAQVLLPTGKSCQSYYSLYPAGIVCLKDVEYKRQFRVTYKFSGEVRTADLDWYPMKKFAVTADGTPIDPDTSNQFKTEHDR